MISSLFEHDLRANAFSRLLAKGKPVSTSLENAIGNRLPLFPQSDSHSLEVKKIAAARPKPARAPPVKFERWTEPLRDAFLR